VANLIAFTRFGLSKSLSFRTPNFSEGVAEITAKNQFDVSLASLTI
jgi:hypothetical protein